MKRKTNGRVRLITAGVLLSMLLAGCPWDSPEGHLARGKELAASAKHAEAVIEIKNFLQTNPKSVEARFLLGRELLATNNPKAAAIELQKAYDGKYPRETVVPLLASCFFQLGEYDKIAVEVAKGDLSAPGANADLQSIFGWSLLSRGKSDEALRAFRRAQQDVPGVTSAMIGEAKVKVDRGDVDGASAEVADVLAKDPGHVEGLILKGDIARLRNAAPAAIEAYLEATKRAPRNLVARLHLTGVYFATNQLDLAREQVTELRRLAPGDPNVNYQDALLAFTTKDYSHAADAVRLTLNESPGSGAAEILAGAIAIANNQPEQAELHLQEGLRQVPQSAYARKLLAQLYLNRQDVQRAEDVLRPVTLAFPNDSSVAALSGQVALKGGKFSEASKLFAKAAEIDPANAQAHAAAATAQFANGDEVQGFAILEAAASSNAANPLPRTTLVLAHLQRGQYDKALEAWKPLLTERPDDPVIYNLRAAIAIGQKDYAEARKALERAVAIQPDYAVAVLNLAALDEMAGDVAQARSRYTALISKDNKNATAMVGLAKLEAKHGAKPDLVIGLLNDARKVNPSAEEPTLALAAYYVSRNQSQNALAVVQEGLSKTPTSLNLRILLADLLEKSGNFDQAIVAYRKIVAERPTVLEYQIALGRALLAANQFDNATEVFSSVLKANPNDVAAQAIAVNGLLSANKLDQANRLISEIRKANPKAPALVEFDGDSKFAAKQYAEAAVAYRKLAAQSPSGKSVIKVYMALQLSGNVQGADSALSNWIKSHPDDAVARSFDADMAFVAKDYPRAAEGYRSVLRLRPNDATTLNNLASTLSLQKDSGALAIAKRASEIAPNDPMVNDTLGWILVEQGDIRQGLEILRRASAAAPKQSDIALHLAKAQMKDGRNDEARQTLQALVKNAPESPAAKESKSLLAVISGGAP